MVWNTSLIDGNKTGTTRDPAPPLTTPCGRVTTDVQGARRKSTHFSNFRRFKETRRQQRLEAIIDLNPPRGAALDRSAASLRIEPHKSPHHKARGVFGSCTVGAPKWKSISINHWFIFNRLALTVWWDTETCGIFYSPRV